MADLGRLALTFMEKKTILSNEMVENFLGEVDFKVLIQIYYNFHIKQGLKWKTYPWTVLYLYIITKIDNLLLDVKLTTINQSI